MAFKTPSLPTWKEHLLTAKPTEHGAFSQDPGAQTAPGLTALFTELHLLTASTTFNPLQQICGRNKAGLINPVLFMEKSRHREGKERAQGHTELMAGSFICSFPELFIQRSPHLVPLSHTIPSPVSRPTTVKKGEGKEREEMGTGRRRAHLGQRELLFHDHSDSGSPGSLREWVIRAGMAQA